MTDLSPNFTEEEFTRSDTAKRLGIDNSLTPLHRKIAIHTCQYLLEPLRTLLNQHYGCKVIITLNSGYRSAALNAKIPGASKTSQHCNGEAADISCYKVINKINYKIQPLEIYNLIKTWVKQGKLSVDQCIYEVSGGAIWVHVSHSNAGKTRDRRQFLKYNNGKYTLDN